MISIQDERMDNEKKGPFEVKNSQLLYELYAQIGCDVSLEYWQMGLDWARLDLWGPMPCPYGWRVSCAQRGSSQRHAHALEAGAPPALLDNRAIELSIKNRCSALDPSWEAYFYARIA